MADHARFSPSAAHRWMTCPGSVALSRDIPNTSSEYAAEGTAAHTLASRALTYDKPAEFFAGETFEVEGWVFTADEEMCEAVQIYLDEVNARVGKGTLMFEQKIGFSNAIGVPDQFGTSDAIILSEDCKSAQIGDLKYGMGVRVVAEENEQLMTYAVGVLETYAVVMDQVETVELFIVQPRLDHIDSWTCTVERLTEHAKRLRLAAAAALEGCEMMDADGVVPTALFKPSEDACQFCPAKVDCKALREKVSNEIYGDFQALDDPTSLAVLGEPSLPRLDRLGAAYGVLDLIEGWCRSVRAEVERMVMAGMTVVGPDGTAMKVVEGKKGNRAWTDAEKARALLAGILPPEKYLKPQEIITPSVADKLLNKAKTLEQWKLFGDLISQAQGKPKVTLGSDPAPSYHADAGAHEFEVLE
jgi:hypothetical protein